MVAKDINFERSSSTDIISFLASEQERKRGRESELWLRFVTMSNGLIHGGYDCRWLAILMDIVECSVIERE